MKDKNNQEDISIKDLLNEPAKMSFSKEENKPLIVNDEAAGLCVDIIQGRYHGEDFEVDELFLEHYKEVKGKDNPTQEEINKFIIALVEECDSDEAVVGDAEKQEEYSMTLKRKLS